MSIENAITRLPHRFTRFTRVQPYPETPPFRIRISTKKEQFLIFCVVLALGGKHPTPQGPLHGFRVPTVTKDNWKHLTLIDPSKKRTLIFQYIPLMTIKAIDYQKTDSASK